MLIKKKVNDTTVTDRIWSKMIYFLNNLSLRNNGTKN